jgi:hypothetical protein
MALRRNPIVYEINTWVWLADLSKRFGRQVTLGNIPSEVFDELEAWSIDAVWLMGVWERSAKSREIAYRHPDLQHEFYRTLPEFTQEDVIGSAYSISRYEAAALIGGRDGLAAFRAGLKLHNIALILDYVPNHVSIDHHWMHDTPNALIRGTEETIAARPSLYFRTDNGLIFAHGRDPYFPAWTDTAQVNAFSAEGRAKSLETLKNIATQCDGVRCDMAMLMVNRIFGNLWGLNLPNQQTPTVEFWQEIIPAIKAVLPDFVFIAEVYWEMEAELITQGFDYTYDKRLYDRMLHESVHTVRDHLLAASSYQRHMVRFIENHDEQRAVTSFGLEKSQAAATMILTLPGAKLLHEGQFDGRKVRVPVQLGSRPNEKANPALSMWYHRLLATAGHDVYHEGTFMSLASHPILSSDVGHESVFCFAWVLGSEWQIVAVNLSNQAVKARVMIPRPDFAGIKAWTFRDILNPDHAVLYDGDDLLTSGLVVDLPAYGANLFQIERA